MEMTIRWWLMVAAMAVLALPSSTAVAEDGYRVVIIEIPDGDNQIVADELSEIEGLELLSHDSFVSAAESRAFHPQRVLDEPSDLEWVMDGGNINMIIDFREEDDRSYRVRLITDENAESEHEFLADRDPDGAIVRGGAAIIRLELQQFLGDRTGMIADAVAAGHEQESGPEGDSRADAQPGEDRPLDPEAMRQAAAEDDAELREALSRNMLWVRGHARLFQKDFSAAAREAVLTHKSGGFPGYELDVEVFPLGPSNPDMMHTGFYASVNHGLYSVDGADDDGEEGELSVNNLTVEGGAIYRFDSPLDGDNRQIRVKLGGRYETFSIDDNPELPSTALASLVLGTRVVMPVGMGLDELALTAAADLVPLGMFTTGEEVFGETSFSYGFGAELGALFEVMENGFLSGGYTFRMMRSDFEGEGEQFGHEAHPVTFEDSEVFDLNQGLRLGFVYQY